MDESVLHGIFWNHLVYPEFAAAEVEDPAITLAWVSARLPSEQWPDYVVCLVLDDLASFTPEERRGMLQRVRGVISETLPVQQCALLGFAHSNAVYFCGNYGKSREALLQRLWMLNQRIVAELLLSNTLGIAGDSTATALVLDEVTRALFQQAYLPLLHLRPILQCQVIFMAQAAMDVGVDAESTARQSERFLAQIGVTYDYSCLAEILADAARCFSLLVEQRFRNLTHRLVATAEDYVMTHLTDAELSLQQLAGYLGASPAHISRTFKKIKGMGLTRYINEQRGGETAIT